MINLSIITKALQDQLNNNVQIREILNGQEVVRGELINMDVNRTPWIGVYRGNVKYEPRTLGSMNNWEASPSVKVIIQAVHLESAEQCEVDLEGYVQNVLDAVIADTTIGGTIDMITSYDVEVGYIETDRSTISFQGASITFNMEVATS